MTIQEFRLDWLKQGYTVSEAKIQNSSLYCISVKRYDADSFMFELRANVHEAIYQGSQNNEYVTLICNMITTISNIIVNRHAQPIESCEHDEGVIIKGKKGCSKCMGKFGDMIAVTLNEN